MHSIWDEDLAILSAENVSFSVQTAGLGSRLAAWTIDFGLQVLVLLLGALVAAGAYQYLLDATPLSHLMTSVLEGLGSIFGFLIFFGYFFFFEALWEGQTPGKRMLGLRVVMANGTPLTVWPALARNVVRLVDFMPPPYGIGAVTALLNPLNQRVGDLAAGTIVTLEQRREKERKTLTINQAVELFLKASEVPNFGADAEKTALGPDGETPFSDDQELEFRYQQKVDPEAAALSLKLTREDYELARDFLTRSATLKSDSRRRLGHALTVRLATRLGTAPGADEELWLGEIVQVLGRAYGRDQ